MKTENTTKEARLDFFALLYENAKNNYSDAIEFYERNAKQYKGSSEIDGSNERATTVRNITYEIVESEENPDKLVIKFTFGDETATYSYSEGELDGEKIIIINGTTFTKVKE